MQWQKLGQVFGPTNNYEWMVSHAANPVAKHLEGDVFKSISVAETKKIVLVSVSLK